MFLAVGPTKYFPIYGSFSLFQEVKKFLFPDLLLNPMLAAGLVGLCHQENRNSPIIQLRYDHLGQQSFHYLKEVQLNYQMTLKCWLTTDQTELSFPSTSSRFPLLPILKLAKVFATARGFSLLATHTILRADIFLCHNPTYLLA